MNKYILQIDTATEICSVSLSLNGSTLSEIISDEPNMHASKLTVYIEELLQTSEIEFSHLSAVCLSKGPGSYTGLRIGTSTAKGLCYALDIPLLAINTLDNMFFGMKSQEDVPLNTIFIPMLDARRMEVYMKGFGENGEVLIDTEARIIDENCFQEFKGNNVLLFGSGASKLQSMFANHSFIKIKLDFEYRSSYMSSLAYEKLVKNEVENLIYFEPFYLKEFIPTTPKSKL